MSMVLGAVVALGGMAAMQLPLLNRPAVATVTLSPVLSERVTPLEWPSVGSAALVIPSLGVARSWNNEVVPIASLTKLMTAYVVLERLPLSPGETGPCVTVSPSDVQVYDQMKATDQSSVVVVAGESLCELDLLAGLLVHSASNYATLLANMVSGSTEGFVSLMNSTAASLGLTGTTYADVSGFDPGSVSTAMDQAKLAVRLMRSPLVRSLVAEPSITLPVAGTVTSFTPYVGVDNVVGVKSGRTSEAGGCDVMAMSFQQGSSTRLVYAVVLGQRGGDLLGPAGDAALALANSAVANHVEHTFARGEKVGTLRWGGKAVSFGFSRASTIWWWSSKGDPVVTAHLRQLRSMVHRGEVVGWLSIRGARTYRFVLRALATQSPPTLLQRLR